VIGLQDYWWQLSAKSLIVSCRTANPTSFLRCVVGSDSLLFATAIFWMLLLSFQFWPMPSISRGVINCAKQFLSHPFSRIKSFDQWAVDRDPVLTSTTSTKIRKTAIAIFEFQGMDIVSTPSTSEHLHQWSQPSNPTATFVQHVALSLALQAHSKTKQVTSRLRA